MRIASPPITHPDFYGIDTPEQSKPARRATTSLDEMRDFIGVTASRFLSVDGLYRAVGYEAARPDPAAIHRPLLHRRLSDAASPTRGSEAGAARQLSLLAEAG